MPKIELDINFVCARCKKALEGTQVYGTLIKVEPCPCYVRDLKKEQEDEFGRKWLPDDLGQ